MPNSKELYQELILDHSKNPKNFGKLSKSTNSSESKNASCGDQVVVEMNIHNNTIQDIQFSGCGCAILKASASLMTEELQGKTIQEAKQLFSNFEQLLTTDNSDIDNKSKLTIFANIRNFPSRVKCAALPWHTMKKALEEQSQQHHDKKRTPKKNN